MGFGCTLPQEEWGRSLAFAMDSLSCRIRGITSYLLLQNRDVTQFDPTETSGPTDVLQE